MILNNYSTGQLSDINSLDFRVSPIATLVAAQKIAAGGALGGKRFTSCTLSLGSSPIYGSELAVSGEWLYLDPITPGSLQISLLSGGGTAQRNTITMNPGDFIRANYSSVKIVGCDFWPVDPTVSMNCRIVYGTGMVDFISQPPDTVSFFDSQNNVRGLGAALGGAVGTVATQLIYLPTPIPYDCNIYGQLLVRPPLTNCAVDIIAVSGGAPSAQSTFVAASGVAGAGSSQIVGSGFFPAVGDWPIGVDFLAQAGMSLVAMFRCASGATSTVQPGVDGQNLSFRVL